MKQKLLTIILNDKVKCGPGIFNSKYGLNIKFKPIAITKTSGSAAFYEFSLDVPFGFGWTKSNSAYNGWWSFNFTILALGISFGKYSK